MSLVYIQDPTHANIERNICEQDQQCVAMADNKYGFNDHADPTSTTRNPLPEFALVPNSEGLGVVPAGNVYVPETRVPYEHERTNGEREIKLRELVNDLEETLAELKRNDDNDPYHQGQLAGLEANVAALRAELDSPDVEWESMRVDVLGDTDRAIMKKYASPPASFAGRQQHEVANSFQAILRKLKSEQRQLIREMREELDRPRHRRTPGLKASLKAQRVKVNDHVKACTQILARWRIDDIGATFDSDSETVSVNVDYAKMFRDKRTVYRIPQSYKGKHNVMLDYNRLKLTAYVAGGNAYLFSTGVYTQPPTAGNNVRTIIIL